VLTIPEKSRQGFAFICEDEDRRAFVPGTCRLRVHDQQTETELQGWTEIPPAMRMEVFIAATVNRILNDNNAYEYRVLTVQSDYDTDDQLSKEEVYRIENLRGFQ